MNCTRIFQFDFFEILIFFFKHGIKRAQLIPVSGAFHTELMMSAQAPLRKVLDSVNIRTPKCVVYSGTSCAPFTSPDIIKR